MNNLYENLITDNIQESDFLLSNINNKILIKDSNNQKPDFYLENLNESKTLDTYTRIQDLEKDLLIVEYLIEKTNKLKTELIKEFLLRGSNSS